MWHFIIYFVVMIIGIAVINRYAEDHPTFTESGPSIYDISGRAIAVTFCIFWPLFMPFALLVLVCVGIYCGIYYVVDKIYTKIISWTNRHK